MSSQDGPNLVEDKITLISGQSKKGNRTIIDVSKSTACHLSILIRNKVMENFKIKELELVQVKCHTLKSIAKYIKHHEKCKIPNVENLQFHEQSKLLKDVCQVTLFFNVVLIIFFLG